MPAWDNGKPTGIYIASDGRVWIPDTHYARVIVYDRDGVEQFRFGERGTGPGQFIFPTSIAIDSAGCIYVSEYGDSGDRISKFSPQRKFLFSFGGADAGDARLIRPADIGFDDDDTLWVADACHHRICRFDTNGKLLGSFGTPGTEPGQLNYPYGLCLEPGHTILVADHGNNRISRYRRDGTFIASWGAPGRAVGQLTKPWDVDRGRDGRVYCLDSWNNRVQVIDW
jgi:DNA-binding beta-propeller fold protein YncE